MKRIAWLLFFLTVGLLLAGLLGEAFLLTSPYQAALETLSARSQALQKLWQDILRKDWEEGQAATLLLQDPALSALLQRFRDNIETEADYQQLLEKLSNYNSRLTLEQESLTKAYQQKLVWWRAGWLVLLIALWGWGAWQISLAQSRTETTLKAIDTALQRWEKGQWEGPLPTWQQARWQAFQTLFQTIEQVINALKASKTAFEVPPLTHPLAHKLTELREALVSRALSESEQLKTIQGLAEFSDIVKESRSIEELSQKTIRLLCRLLEAHAGAIFIREEDFYEIRGTYAYDLEQVASRRFRVGEGFAGQAALEKRLLVVHPVPPSYLRLRSGLGETTPHTLLLMPLVFQNTAYGIVELAALQHFPPFATSFLEKISEHIGAAVANFISQAHLQALLSREQTLRSSLEQKQEELLRSMTLLEEAQQKILASQEQLASQLLAIRSAALVAEIDLQGHIRYANQPFLELLGQTEQSILGQPFSQWLAAESDRLAFARLLENPTVWQTSLALAHPSGKALWLQVTMAPLRTSADQGLILIAFDITRQKEQEAQLRQMLEDTIAQEERLREANRRLEASRAELQKIHTELEGQIAAIGNAAIVAETDLQGRIIRVNELFLQMYGYTLEEILGQNHRLLKSGHQPDEVFEEMWRTISKGQVWRGEVRNRAKDGRYYWVLLTITPVLSPEGKVLKYIGVSFDITAQKQQEEALRSALELSQAQERELRRYTEQLQAAQEEMRRTQTELRGQISAVNNAAIVAETDPQGHITFVNDAFCAISGYAREELLGQTHALLKSGQHENAFYEELWQTLSKKRVWKGIFCNKRKDGTLYWVSSTITPVTDPKGRLLKFIAVSFDLTAQIEQEAQLRAYSEELRKAQAELQGQIRAVGNAAYLMETDPEGNLLYANEAALEAWGTSWREVAHQNLRFLNSGHHPPEFWANLWQTIQSGQVWQNEVLNRSKTGQLFWQLLTITPITNAQGQIYKYIGVAFDITSQKRQAERIRQLLQEAQAQERELREYASQLEKVQQELLEAQLELNGRINALNNAAIVSETDPQGCITFVNDEATYVWGYTREELLGQPHSLIRSQAHPTRFFERMWERIQNGFVWQGEVQNRAKDGSSFWVYLTITPVLDQSGKPYKYIGVAFDITRQKVQAQRLKEALRQLETQTHTLPEDFQRLTWFITDKQGLIQGASPALLEMLGYPAELFIGQPARLLRSPQTPPETFLDLWATIGRGKPWHGFLYNRNAKGIDYPYLLSIYPAQDHYLALLLPAQDALNTLKATWLKNYAPIDLVQEYELRLQAKEYEIQELQNLIDKLKQRHND